MQGAPRVGCVLAVLALAALLVVPAATATSHGSAQPTLQTQANNSSVETVATQTGADYDLDELRPPGSRPGPNAPASVRLGGPYTEYAVKTLPTGLWVIEGESSPFWQFMGEGATIQRNYLQLWSKRPYTYGDETVADKVLLVRIAYWERGTQTVQDGNVTREEPVARNVTVVTKRVTLGDGRDYEELSLKPHYDEPVEMTMCIQEPDESDCLATPTDRRWRAVHHSSRAAMTVPTTSAGGRLAWAFGLLILPTFGFTLTTLYGVRRLINRAVGGPRISWLAWMLSGIVLLVGTAIFYDSIVALLVQRPYLIAIPLGVLLGIFVAEWFGDNTYLAAFIRFRLQDVHDPGAAVDETAAGADSSDAAATDGGEALTGEETAETAQGVLAVDIIPQRLARNTEGTRSVITSGLRKFIARARGARADLEFDGNPQTRVEVGHGPYDEAFLLDPEAEDPYRYRPEGFEWSWPDLATWEEVPQPDGTTAMERRWNLKPYIAGIAALGFSWVLGGLVFASNALGLVVGAGLLIALKIYQPVEGVAQAKLAPLHYHTAVGTMLTHAKKLGDAKAWQDLYHDLVSENAKNRADDKNLADAGSRTQAQAVAEEYLGTPEETEAGEPGETAAQNGTGGEEVLTDDD